MTGADRPRSQSDMEYAHDLLKLALLLPEGEFFDNEEDRRLALVAGGIMCWALGHFHEVWMSQLLDRIEARAVKMGVIEEEERRFRGVARVS